MLTKSLSSHTIFKEGKQMIRYSCHGGIMVIRNCLELLKELSELERIMDEHKRLLKSLNIEVDCDETLISTLKTYLSNKQK